MAWPDDWWVRDATGGMPVGGYENAPIAEAILNFYFPEPIDHSLLVAESLQVIPHDIGWTDFESGQMLDAALEFPKGGMESRLAGIAFRQEDQSRELLVSTTSLSFTRRGKYSNWDDFTSEALQAWYSLKKLGTATDAASVSSRFVNLLPVPSPFDSRDYLRIVPEVSSYLPPVMDGFLMTTTIPLSQDRSRQVNVVVGTTDNDGTPALALDLECFVSTGGDLGSTLEGLRTLKNQVFEASITDATRELIK